MSGLRDDLDAMVYSAAYVLCWLVVAERLRRRGMASTTTRKIVHVAVGTWVLPTFLLFEHRFWAVVPPSTFVLVNAASLRWGLIRSVEGEERSLGTVLYPLSVAAALWWAWPDERRVLGAAAILVLAWGDAAASLVGRRWGRHAYRVLGHPRSLEGSGAMFTFSLLAIVVAAFVLGGPVGPGLLLAAACAAGAATLVEAGSLFGTDNLLVPAAVALVLWTLGVGA